MLAFILSLLISVGVFYGEDYHVIVVLEAHPDSLFGMLLNVALLGIAPIVASFALHFISYLKGNYAGIASFQGVIILVVGVFSMGWGSLFCEASYVSYYDAVSLARAWHIVNIDGHILKIYLAYGIVGAVWLIFSVFLTAVSTRSLLRQA